MAGSIAAGLPAKRRFDGAAAERASAKVVGDGSEGASGGAEVFASGNRCGNAVVWHAVFQGCRSMLCLPLRLGWSKE